MSRRDKLDIIKEILSLCRNKSMKKTRIAYVSNLNFQKASEYLDWLMIHDLIREEKKGNYKTTAEGDALLANLDRLGEVSKDA
ncbi:Winged helix-turn-helix [uncultured archaeon]|nr:Winged helix-turn-helix [uncultured archaeon]